MHRPSLCGISKEFTYFPSMDQLPLHHRAGLQTHSVSNFLCNYTVCGQINIYKKNICFFISYLSSCELVASILRMLLSAKGQPDKL